MAAMQQAERSGWHFDGRSTADEVVAGVDLASRNIIVTGGNTGIGLETARALARTGARVIFTSRDREAGERAQESMLLRHAGLPVEVRTLDLGAFDSIVAFTEALDIDTVDAVVCNAGLTAPRFDPTEEGFERTVGVCHVGHSLLLRLLAPRLLAAQAPRVVMVSSESHRMPKTLEFERFPMTKENYSPLVAYGQAKLCNVLLAQSLQRRYGARGLTACSLHPGTLITTDIGRDSMIIRMLIKLVSPFTKSPNQGAATSALAVVHEPASDVAGAYLSDCVPARCSAEGASEEVADRLWQMTEAWLAEQGDFAPWP